MTQATALESEFEQRIGRGCGATCLSMVYKSFGREIPQAEIWPSIAKPNRFGQVSSTTHLMALHAWDQGFSAVAIQARHPIQVLQLCRQNHIRAIINQRASLDSSAGHYTLMVDIDDHSVMLKDPSRGPLRRISHVELLRLWHPSTANSEIAGNVLIGIADHAAEIPPCEFCHAVIPAAMNCPRCHKAVPLRPAAILGCARDGCIARMWEYIACPFCDFLFNETGPATNGPRRAETQKQQPPITDFLALDRAFAQLDKLAAQMLRIPGMADHPDLKAQLDFININKEKARRGQVEEFTEIKARLDGLVLARAEKERRLDEQRRKREELHAPLPQIDGRVVGESLLRSLGLECYRRNS